ncbi:MAG TPA: HipA family kinase [Parapedobacter sp.]|uniref:HipA family kinase n=1 Tax=Parapedobacter sp. TaxID=1958893 RepID=UPI002D1B8121|nr:HipA family kinase [Parapedobacter sp.]HWK56517.1 HipA family kinase [Parapedobacter sp.]
MSIKAPEFKLSYVYAVEAHKELANSANMPLVVSAVDVESGIRGQYVVKLNDSERMHAQGRLRELVAAFMALELGIPVVIPAVIEVSQDFVETLRGKDFYGKASRSLGYNVGSEYLKNMPTLDNHIPLGEAQKKIGQHIFAFDLLIENVDRNFEKPNMLTDGSTLVMLDHELAFGFALTLGFLRNPIPWAITENDHGWITAHCLHRRLKGCVDELADFSDKLVNLDAEFWDKVGELIPAEWFDETLFTEIKNHCDGMVAHRDEFIQGIKQLLA